MGAQWKAKPKAEAAAARGKLFTKLAKEIIVSARISPEPEANPRLRKAIEQARRASMPRDTLERAIKKGAGLLDGDVHYETVTYEGFAPRQVPVIVECLTENKNRTAMNVRMLFRKGQLANSGSVSWDFKHVGIIEARRERADADPELAAIEAGAQDLESWEDGSAMFYTDLTDLDAVTHALPEFGYAVLSAKPGYRANNPVSLPAEARAEVEAFLQALDDDDDVQNVFAGLAD
ncbi:MAG: YebC/PmpR family DNA-binding transcriptional regulator [Gammaproteobacteria bacterium]